MSRQKKEPAKKKETPARHTPTKTRKSPRGLKSRKHVDRLLNEVVDQSHPRHRNAYNHRMAQVAKLARML